jgi:hypothetical protein
LIKEAKRLQQLAGILNEINVGKPSQIHKIEYGDGPMRVLEDQDIFYFEDGFLGSTGHGASYYEHFIGDDAREIGLLGKKPWDAKNIAVSTIEADDWGDNEAKNDFFREYNGYYLVYEMDEDKYAGNLMNINPKEETVTLYTLPIGIYDSGYTGYLLYFDDNLNIIINPEFEEYIIA